MGRVPGRRLGRQVQVTCYISEEHLEMLNRLRHKTRVPKNVYIKEGIKLVLRKYKKDLDA